jgi:hypothetical protein
MPYRPSGEGSLGAALQEEHRAQLMAIDGVEGVGIGQDSTGSEGIVVYARDPGVAQRVPRTIAGMNVDVQVTGRIDAL